MVSVYGVYTYVQYVVCLCVVCAFVCGMCDVWYVCVRARMCDVRLCMCTQLCGV